MSDLQHLRALEKSVDSASTQLYTVVHKLHAVEQGLSDDNMAQVDDMCVLELLESMTEVRNEYQNLRKDLQEVQQLQRDVTSSIQVQMRSMQQTFQMLKKRIELKTAKNTSCNSSNITICNQIPYANADVAATGTSHTTSALNAITSSVDVVAAVGNVGVLNAQYHNYN